MNFAAIDQNNYAVNFEAINWEEAEEYCNSHALIQCGELIEEIALTNKEYKKILKSLQPTTLQ